MDRVRKRIVKSSLSDLKGKIFSNPCEYRSIEHALEQFEEGLFRSFMRKWYCVTMDGDDRLDRLMAAIRRESPGCTVTEDHMKLPDFPGKGYTIRLSNSMWHIYDEPGAYAPVLFHGELTREMVKYEAIKTKEEGAVLLQDIDDIVSSEKSTIERFIMDANVYDKVRDIHKATYGFQIDSYINPLKEHYEFTIIYKDIIFELRFRETGTNRGYWHTAEKVPVRYEELDSVMPAVVANLTGRLADSGR